MLPPILVCEPVNKANENYLNSYMDDQGNRVYTIDVDADGNLNVPKDSCNVPVLPVDSAGRLIQPRDLNNRPLQVRKIQNGENTP